MPPRRVRRLVSAYTLHNLPKLSLQRCWQIARSIGIPYKRTLTAAQLRSLIADILIEEEMAHQTPPSTGARAKTTMFSQEEDDIPTEQNGQYSAAGLSQGESVSLALELAKINLEQTREQRAFAREEFDRERERRQFSHSVNDFSLQKAVQLVPRFNEAEPEQFFESFENQARALRWPEQHWAALVHTALLGKAQEFTSVLTDAEFSDYQVVKTTVLGAYTCIPAKYRKTFKLNRRQLGQSLVDFVRQQTKAFTSWYKASGVSNFEELVQLILIDNLLESVGPEVRVFLQDRDLTTALEAARLADTFETNRSLSERSCLSFQQSGVSRDRQHWRMKCQQEGERLRHPNKSPGEPRFSTYGPPAERQTTYGASRQQYPERHQPERHHLQRHQGVKGKPVVCFRCNKVDACESGVGAVLLQIGNKELQPVAYFSAKFQPHQRAYSTIEKEALALVLALEHFDVYVGQTSQVVTVYSDHNPLVYLQAMKNHNTRLMRWTLRLQPYNFKIQYIAGKENVLADSLSRV
ncbi:uncharacterized protein [Cherax quadricarinatus]|uniref:uncharacterized protein n=1 Tax=Cherax quadricarinatus TaxID=27406 RepID=UPI00387E9C6D